MREEIERERNSHREKKNKNFVKCLLKNGFASSVLMEYFFFLFFFLWIDSWFIICKTTKLGIKPILHLASLFFFLNSFTETTTTSHQVVVIYINNNEKKKKKIIIIIQPQNARNGRRRCSIARGAYRSSYCCCCLVGFFFAGLRKIIVIFPERKHLGLARARSPLRLQQQRLSSSYRERDRNSFRQLRRRDIPCESWRDLKKK